MRICFKIAKIARLHRRPMSTRPNCYELTISHSSLTTLHRPLLPPHRLFLHPCQTLTIFHRPLTSPCSPFLHLRDLLTYRCNSNVFSHTLTPLCRHLKTFFHPSVPDNCPLTPPHHLLTPPLSTLTLCCRPLTPLRLPLTPFLCPLMPV